MTISLQYPLGRYSASNKPSNETLKGDLSMIQTAVNAQEASIALKQDALTAATLTGAETLTNKTLSTGVKLDANAEQNITQYGMARQAIMNGNFDVWQRGTSVALADVTASYQADRWYDVQDKNGGTLPTLTRSQQLLTSGDIPGAKYFSRLATNGAGTSLGVSSYGVYVEKIENGTSKLCGASKKVTLSFWARSSIANKRITPTLDQNYGTGGSPSSVEYILGTPITLTSSWVKYTATFTTNTLVGKTFGTNSDDYLGLVLWNMWGSTIGNTRVQASVSAETYIGSGNIDIAQVQLCSGDVALPFQPKSYEEELRACQRYAEIISTDADNQPITNEGRNGSTTAGACPFIYRVEKRAIPTVTFNSTIASFATYHTSVVLSGITSANIGKSSCNIGFTVAAGLTAGQPECIRSAGAVSGLIKIEAEL